MTSEGKEVREVVVQQNMTPSGTFEFLLEGELLDWTSPYEIPNVGDVFVHNGVQYRLREIEPIGTLVGDRF